jgi:alanine racemase
MALTHQSPLVIANDETAQQVFDGRYSADLIEAPEPDVDRVGQELAEVSASVGSSVKVCLTLKSQFCRPSLDRYVPVLLAASPQVDSVAVTSVEEAIQLRSLGVKQRVVLLNVQAPELAPMFERFNLEPSVVSRWWLKEMRRYASRPVPLHLWVDTGLGREGLLPEDAAAVLSELRRGDLAGLASHLAAVPYRYPDGSVDTDGPKFSREFTEAQLERFEAMRAEATAVCGPGFRSHVAASGSIQRDCRSTYFDMVRPGRVVVERFVPQRGRRVLAIRTTEHHARVAQVKQLPPGWSIGYLGTGRHTTPATVALLTTSPGVRVSAGPVSFLKNGVRHELPLLISHTGMCVVRVDNVQIEPGDVVDLNYPDGVDRERMVPLSDAFDGTVHDILRNQTIVLKRWRRLVLHFRAPDQSLITASARPRYRGPSWRLSREITGLR